MEDTDESLLIERARHEPEAFGELYRRYVTRIYRYHYRHLGNHAEAEDLTSRTFFQALRAIHRYQPQGGTFQAWLFRIAHNLMANFYRDQSRHPGVGRDVVTVTPSLEMSLTDRIERAEDTQQLLAALEALPEERKTLILLKFVEQLSNAEIAVVLGKTEGAIKALYNRTLVSLRRALAEGEHHANTYRG